MEVMLWALLLSAASEEDAAGAWLRWERIDEKQTVRFSQPRQKPAPVAKNGRSVFRQSTEFSGTPRGQGSDPSAGVGLDPRLNDPVPLGAVFTNDSDRVVRLEECIGGKPTLLVLLYYRCPMLCGEVLDGLVRSLRTLSLTAGRDFNVVAVSIDPRETFDLAYLKKEAVVRRYARPGSEGGWHFLTGGEGSVGTLARAVGFRYRYDERTKQY